jgi:tetratricopeptide (TPR) repeat protein
LADAHYSLGVSYWQRGEFPQAADHLRAAVQAKPDYAEAFYTLGTVLKQQGNLPDAVAALREAIRLQPEFAGAHTTLAALLRQQGDMAGAQAESRAAQEITRTQTNSQAARFSLNSGNRLLNAGDWDGAIVQFQTAIKLAPDSPIPHYQLALALRHKGQTAEARSEFEKAAALDPKLQPPPQ